MRLAWVSPLPPNPSGIADYSFEMLSLVGELAEVEAFARKPRRTLRRIRRPPGVRVLPPESFRPGRHDAVLYHLGNNPEHDYVYRMALEHPGVVVLHDFVLHHLVAHLYAEEGTRDWDRYESLLTREYGPVGAKIAELRRRLVATNFEKFLFPLNEHVARRARALVVHSEGIRDRLTAVVPDTPITVIPHHAGTPPAPVAGVGRDEARRRLGLPRDAFVVGHLGYVTMPKQPGAVLGGFARLAERHPDAVLTIVGADHSGGGLSRLIESMGLLGKVRVAGYVDLVRFYLYLRAVDAVVNLRYPSAGESSGTFARALAEGRATIVSDLGSFAQVPSDVALKVQVDGDQAEEVGRHLLRLAEDGAFRSRVEEGARRYAAAALNQRRCARLYLEAATAARAPAASGAA